MRTKMENGKSVYYGFLVAVFGAQKQAPMSDIGRTETLEVPCI